MIKLNHLTHKYLWPVIVVIGLLLTACERSQPSTFQIQSYIENYRIGHDYKVASMDYQIDPEIRGKSGTIRVSGKLELREPLYVEDLGNREFRKEVASMLRRNRFSEREISHEIYDRVIRATARVQDRENEYYTFLKEEYAPGYAINFSADLKYRKGSDGYMLDGTVNHPKLHGDRLIKFNNPVVDHSKLVEKAVKGVLAEQARYRELMKGSSAILRRLWDNEHGLVVWNRKVPYLGIENLSVTERAQLQQYKDWRGVYFISNIKPIQFNTPHASNFFELGSYVTEGVATCLRQTGFSRELNYRKNDIDHFCQFGKQYPAQIRIASTLSDTNKFTASVEFEIGEISTGKLNYQAPFFQREDNEVARYSDQLRVLFLDRQFNLRAHNRPKFSLIKSTTEDQDLLHLGYTGATAYEVAGFYSTKGSLVMTTAPTAQQPVSQQNPVTEQKSETTTVVPKTNNETPAQQPQASKPKKASSPEAQTAKTIEEKAVTPKATGEAGETDQQASSTLLTKTELVKAIQTELKRLKVYTAGIDGIAGEQTFWAMDYVQKQLKADSMAKPSQEFLTLLQNASADDISAPEKTNWSVASEESEPEKKKTVVGKAFGWAKGLFKKKERKPEN